jgi:hypothetical protein
LEPKEDLIAETERVKKDLAILLKKLIQMSEMNIATISLNGEKENFILNNKDFKTGSRGYHGQGKMQVGEKRYQINIMCVEIGSKPKEKGK